MRRLVVVMGAVTMVRIITMTLLMLETTKIPEWVLHLEVSSATIPLTVRV